MDDVKKTTEFVACHECDLLHNYLDIKPGKKALCFRCGGVLYKRTKGGLQPSIAFCLSALVLYMVAVTFPFLSMEVKGNYQSISIVNATMILFKNGMDTLGFMVFFFILGFPFLKIVTLLCLEFPLLFKKRLRFPATLLKIFEFISPWNLSEVFLLGTIVALVKIADLASVTLEMAFWAFCGQVICTIAAIELMDKSLIWSKIKLSKKSINPKENLLESHHTKALPKQ